MTFRMIGTEVYLEGDWTYAAVSQNLESLALSLEQLESGMGAKFSVDCRQVTKVDANGLQVLRVWMECARMRGVEPKLVNMSKSLKKTMHQYDFK